MTNQPLPQHKDPNNDRRAVAPYNFVPLPPKMVEANPPLDHDQYYAEGLTGWIECRLETCSPTYIRGMMRETVYKTMGERKAVNLSEDEKKAADDRKKERAPFFHVVAHNQPVIPGSSLRGMIRQLVEVISFGRMRYVSPSPTFTFRAVADKGDDPLKNVYKKAVGNNASRVKAGYLEEHDGEWYIRPGQTQKQVGWNRQSSEQYVKVYDEDITNLPGFVHLRDAKYRPQIHPISFERGVEKKKTNWQKGKETRPSILVGTETQYKYVGTLVCVGDMNENRRDKKYSSQTRQEETTPRKKHIIVLPADEQAKLLPIPAQVVEDYLAGLSPFQKDELSAWTEGRGCLGEGKPVFYIENDDETIRYFGHNLNFRIPVSLKGKARAATPQDFVPAGLRETPQPDLADAIFGWVEEKEWVEIKGADGKVTRVKKIIGPVGQRSGRVFFSDAHFQKATREMYFRPNPIVPHILSGPKPTTFQHYLVQDPGMGHNPDRKNSLAHYGTPPQETMIRGYKFYWHKGATPPIEATSEEREHTTQTTYISPLNIGCQFQFKIHFENLRPEELGALCWALTLPSENGKIYRHKIGMGKPIGMGSVAISLENLYVTERKERYHTLFDAENWFQAEYEESIKAYRSQFEHYIENKLGIDQTTPFNSLERIQTLLKMLEWFENATEDTRYMEIEHSTKGNEYKERPVLPNADKVAERLRPAAPPKPPWPQVGERIQGKTYKVENLGTYVEIQGFSRDEVYGFVPIAEQKKSKHKLPHKDKNVECEVIAIHKHEKRIDCRPVAMPKPKK